MKKRYFIHHAVFRLLAPVIIGVLIYLLILLINNTVTQVNDTFNTREVYICIGLAYLSFEIMRLAIIVLQRFVKDYNRGMIIMQLLVTTGATVALVIVCMSLYFMHGLGFSISSSQLWIFSMLYGSTAVFYNVLYLSNYYLHKENTVRLTMEKQHREVLETEMREFKNEINPDLLYESLESLINLMYRDVEKAEEYIDCLANAYRYVLTHRKEELVPLTSEVDAARNVVRLLNEKYFGKLQFECSVNPDELQALLIPGSLPVIIEHLVRNTIISRFENFIIRCYLEDDYITLQCKLNDRLIMHPDSDAALARLQKSYSLYSDQPMISIKAYEDKYIKLPVIRFAEDEQRIA